MAKSQTTTVSNRGSVFQAFQANPADADLAYDAVEEIREMAGRNVLGEIEILKAKLEGTIATRSAELQSMK